MALDPDDVPEPGFDAAWESGFEGPEPPDDVGLVAEVADMMAVFAAQRLRRVDRMRRNALADAHRYGGALAAVIDRSVRLELAAGLRITEHAAADLMGLAEAMVHRYPAVLDALAHAGITERHGEILVSALDAVEPHIRERLAPRALALAEDLPVGTFRRALRKLVDTERSETLPERHQAALEQRRVFVEPAHDGLAWLHLLGPAVEVHAGHARLTTMAKTYAGHQHETRTLDQLRADILGDLLIDGDTTALAPEARGIRATVTVTVPALALLDHDDAGARGGPAVVEGVGPIPLGRARELCGGADGWMRILTHPETGIVLSVGRDQYRPPPALRKLVRWRADRCMAPGCGIPAARCEIDHTLAWDHGGHTSLDNLAPLCKGHHTLKHHGGWRVQQVDDSGGALQWTSPSGRRYLVQPERRVPVFHTTGSISDAPF